MLKFAIHDQLRVICGASTADPTQIPTSTRVAAASATGLLRTALLHPLSVIRTRLAADIGMPPVLSTIAGGSTALKAWPAVTQKARPQRLYQGIWHCFMHTLGREGLWGLYRGSGLAAVTTVCGLGRDTYLSQMRAP
jgi:Mitochondrial carrier protein